jgi:hypothetical protein
MAAAASRFYASSGNDAPSCAVGDAFEVLS